MKALIQRVSSANVKVDDKIVAAIEYGLLAFIGIEKHDSYESADSLLDKILGYRVFSDEQGKMNLSLQSTDGELLLVSQFTLVADTKKGLRPSFSSAAKPSEAENIYKYFVKQAQSEHPKTQSGVFAADMKVSLLNDGPVTFLLEV